MAGVYQWFECWPTHRRVLGSIPGKGQYLGMCEAIRRCVSHMDLSSSLFLFLSFVLSISPLPSSLCSTL